MDIDVSFKPSANNIQNLKVLSSKESDIFELRLSEVSEFADMCADFCSELNKIGMDAYEMLSGISDAAKDALYKYIPENIYVQNKEWILSFFETSKTLDRAAFCVLLIKKLKKNGINFNEQSFLKKAEIKDTFIYVKNPLSDEAYDVFSQAFNDPRLRYAKSFKEAVCAVADGEVSYCLLPFEEKNGVRLPTITELIFKYSLKISSITPVFGPDGTADIKYALLSTDYNIPKLDGADDRYFEFRIDNHDSTKLFELLTVANSFGLTPYRINTVKFNTDDGDITQYSVVLYGLGADFTPMLTYLTLFSDEFTPIGIYINTD